MKFQKEIVTGAATAKVKIVMFGDYESEACAKATDVVEDLLKEYDGKINFVFRHFPLTKIHQKAHKAAEAAIGASQEGKFWEMHRYIFKHRNILVKQDLMCQKIFALTIINAGCIKTNSFYVTVFC